MPEQERTISPEDWQYYHNLGQEDAARGEYNSQLKGTLGGLFARDIDWDRSAAYNQGQENHRRQTSG